MSELTIVETPKGKPVTVESLLAMRFEAVEEFRGLSKEERITHAHEKIEALRPLAIFAGEVLAQDKDELIEMVGAHHDMFGSLLMQFVDASEDTQALKEIFRSAECRLAVALAFVEGDDDGGDDGDGEAVRSAA